LRLSGKDLSHFAPLFSDEIPQDRQFSLMRVAQKDSAVVLYFKGPQSFTGEDVIEIQGHGIASLVDSILADFVKAGALPALPGEFSFRAVINGKMSLAEAERLNEAIKSENLSAEMASELVGLSEKNSSSVSEVFRQMLLAAQVARGRVESAVDFPEAEEEQARDVEGALSQVKKLELAAASALSAFEAFRLSSREARVTIVGETNAGKSTLFNILCGADRSIVSPVRGTTRDYVELRVHTGKTWIRLLDTAGIRENTGNDEHAHIEREGIEFARDLVEKSQIILWLRRADKQDDALIAKWIEGRSVLQVWSHADLVQDAPVGSVDLLHGDKTEIRRQILGLLQEKIRKAEAQQDDSLWISERQAQHLKEVLSLANRARERLESGRVLDLVGEDLRECERLSKLCIGEDLDDAYIGQIFSQFCLGK
jgi:tRNA modification GTPase